MSEKRIVKLTVISDMVCPWCFLGQRELDIALERVRDLPLKIEVEYRPYKLNPTLVDGISVNRQEYYHSSFGKEKWQQVQTIADARAAKLGITMKWTGDMGQTTRAHRLLLKAYQAGGQDQQQALIRLLYKAHFEEEQDIRSIEMLSDRAEKAGLMSKAEAVAFLESDECLAEVVEMTHEAATNGVVGVPCTVIDNKWAMSGVQSPEVYVQVFQKLAACAAHDGKESSPPPAMRLTLNHAPATATVA